MSTTDMLILVRDCHFLFKPYSPRKYYSKIVFQNTLSVSCQPRPLLINPYGRHKPLEFREGGDIGLFITLVPKVLYNIFLFVGLTTLGLDWLVH